MCLLTFLEKTLDSKLRTLSLGQRELFHPLGWNAKFYAKLSMEVGDE